MKDLPVVISSQIKERGRSLNTRMKFFLEFTYWPLCHVPLLCIFQPEGDGKRLRLSCQNSELLLLHLAVSFRFCIYWGTGLSHSPIFVFLVIPLRQFYIQVKYMVYFTTLPLFCWHGFASFGWASGLLYRILFRWPPSACFPVLSWACNFVHFPVWPSQSSGFPRFWVLLDCHCFVSLIILHLPICHCFGRPGES